MSTPALLPNADVIGEFAPLEMPLALSACEVPPGTARRVLSGTSALGAGIFIERGAVFLANVMAARLAGASTFGAYSLGISTANNISTYAAGGIGATAARFSGKYAYGSEGYTTLGRALSVVSLASAAVAALALCVGAAPIAHLLHREDLTSLLRWAAVSAGGIILLECARGFFVGQRRLAAVVSLSLLVGVGLISLLPWAASSHQPSRMIVTQGMVTIAAVSACLLLAKPLSLLQQSAGPKPLPLLPVMREVWGFGVVQLAGLVGANLSGWWLTALVARSDVTLVQMSFLAIASQLRNVAGLVPGLLTEGSYAVMADPTHEHLRTPQRVMAVCTFASTMAAFAVASAGVMVAPWLLTHLYGASYGAGAMTAIAGLGVAVVHMGNAPAAARLSIVSIRATGVINTVWAVVVALSATALLFHGGSAALAMGIFLAAHMVSAMLVLFVLRRKDHVPYGMFSLFTLSSLSICLLLLLTLLRNRYSASAPAFIALTSFISLGGLGCMLALGRKHQWLPTAVAVRQWRNRLTSEIRRTARFRRRRGGHV